MCHNNSACHARIVGGVRPVWENVMWVDLRVSQFENCFIKKEACALVFVEHAVFMTAVRTTVAKYSYSLPEHSPV